MLNDVNKLYGYLLSHSGNVWVTVDDSSVDLNILSGQIENIPLSTTIKIKLVLDPRQVRYLVEAFDVSESMKRETKLRENNPSLRNAWEEYQLLLKLTK